MKLKLSVQEARMVHFSPLLSVIKKMKFKLSVKNLWNLILLKFGTKGCHDDNNEPSRHFFGFIRDAKDSESAQPPLRHVRKNETDVRTEQRWFENFKNDLKDDPHSERLKDFDEDQELDLKARKATTDNAAKCDA